MDYGICHRAVSEQIIKKNNLHIKEGVAIMKSFPALAVKDVEPDLQKKLNAVLQDMAEDNLLNSEIIEAILEEAGAIVKTASDGQEVIDIFEASEVGRFDAILMDIMMPILDGLEAAKKIRDLNRKDAKDIPIIAMTANAFAEDRKESLDAGMNEHLTKPIDSVKLIKILVKCRNVNRKVLQERR